MQVLALGVTAVVATLLCLLALPLGRVLGVLDMPDGRRKLHGRATPLVGGIACLVPTLLLAGAASLHVMPPIGRLDVVWAVTLSALALFLLGLFDDRHDVAPRWRLAAMIAIASVGIFGIDGLVVGQARILMTDYAVAFGILGYPLTLFAVVGFIVSVNMADGANGLTPGLFCIWTAALAVHVGPELLPLTLVLLVGLGVVLAFNLRGRLFMGDSGIYGVAGMIGMLTVYANDAPGTTLTAEAITAWFIVPALDCMRVIVMRRLRRQSPFVADRGHFHHFLIDHFGQRRAVANYLLLVGLPVAGTVLVPSQAALCLAAEVAGYFLLIAVSLQSAKPAAARPMHSEAF
jgi:UDP-GlcNAc:undecaprenyl-phosphate/decaprenyl-phosphate GlcNAc-1-phosphate transferase